MLRRVWWGPPLGTRSSSAPCGEPRKFAAATAAGPCRPGCRTTAHASGLLPTPHLGVLVCLSASPLRAVRAARTCRLQLLGFSDLVASTLMAAFALGCALGAFAGGRIGGPGSFSLKRRNANRN